MAGTGSGDKKGLGHRLGDRKTCDLPDAKSHRGRIPASTVVRTGFTSRRPPVTTRGRRRVGVAADRVQGIAVRAALERWASFPKRKMK
jgi:hypothetical protein